MKNKVLITVMLSVPVLFNGCNKKERGYLRIDTAEVVLSEPVQTKNIKLESNEDWVIDGPGKEQVLGGRSAYFKWFIVNPAVGNKAETISLSLMPEPSAEKLPLVLTIKSKSGQKEIKVRYEPGS